MTNPAEIRAWNARQRRARAEYALNPATHRVHGPCLRCGDATWRKDGICTNCQGDT